MSIYLESTLSLLPSQLPFDLNISSCPDCQTLRNTMASIPQGAFATYKIRANANNKGGYQDKKDEESKGWSWGKKTPKEQYNFSQYPQELLEQPPVKYNSKLMNSIWGQYNKYSVHNFKQLAGDVMTSRQQTPRANDTAPGMPACFASPAYMGTKSG